MSANSCPGNSHGSNPREAIDAIPKEEQPPATWSVYLVRCPDGALYTGIAKDVARRLEMHKNGKGAKYLRGKSPLDLVFEKQLGPRALALRVEQRIKNLSKPRKEALITDRDQIEEIIEHVSA